MDMEILGFSGLMDDAWVFVRIRTFGVLMHDVRPASLLSAFVRVSHKRRENERVPSALDFRSIPERACATVTPCHRRCNSHRGRIGRYSAWWLLGG